MVNIDELAKRIEEELNELSLETGLKFKVHSSVGDYAKSTLDQKSGRLQDYVNAVLRRIDGTYIALADIKDLFTQYTLDFAVKQEYKEVVENLLSLWIESQLGKIKQYNGINYIITPTPTTTGIASDRAILGEMLPYTINLVVQSIQYGMISNEVVWEINGQVVKRLSASYSTTRSPNSKAETNKNIIDTDNSYASNSVTMTLPYAIVDTLEGQEPIIEKLERDILLGNKDEVYTITRKNGVNNITQKFVLASGQINEENGKLIGLDLVFAYSEGD